MSSLVIAGLFALLAGFLLIPAKERRIGDNSTRSSKEARSTNLPLKMGVRYVGPVVYLGLAIVTYLYFPVEAAKDWLVVTFPAAQLPTGETLVEFLERDVGRYALLGTAIGVALLCVRIVFGFVRTKPYDLRHGLAQYADANGHVDASGWHAYTGGQQKKKDTTLLWITLGVFVGVLALIVWVVSPDDMIGLVRVAWRPVIVIICLGLVIAFAMRAKRIKGYGYFPHYLGMCLAAIVLCAFVVVVYQTITAP